jgi:hypothetical protein
VAGFATEPATKTENKDIYGKISSKEQTAPTEEKEGAERRNTLAVKRVRNI